MKQIFNGCSLIIATALALFSSCTKKIDDAYANPNANVRIPVDNLLPPILSCLGTNGAGHGPYNDYRYLGRYIQNFAFCNSGDMYDQMSSRLIPLGSTAADQTASIYRMHYYDIGQNCMNMIKWAEEEGRSAYVGVGKAIMAWSWLTLTSHQGECILKEAFDQSKITFKYDNQEDVYEYVRQLCWEAIDIFRRLGYTTNQDLAPADAYFFNGDLKKWKQFAFSVLARSYNHISNKSIYNPTLVMQYCDSAINDNADNAMQRFAWTQGAPSASANFYGPLRGNLGGVALGSSTAIRQASYITNLMNGTNPAFGGVADPRAIYMLRKNSNGTFVGVDMNRGQAAITPATNIPENFWGVSQAGGVVNTAPSNDNNCRYIFRNAAPLPVITAAEIKFIKAEAAFRAGNMATAWTAYRDGISLHFDMLTTTYNVNIPAGEEITPAIKNNFLSNTNVVPANPNSLTISHIMLQKYIALFACGVTETWTDMRRYRYSPSVYLGFVAPSGANLHPNNLGKLTYRVYPRYNSETVWNLSELIRIGADKTDWHTKEPWFVLP